MAGEPLRAALAAATTLVRRLHVEDIVSVVAYDDDVEVIGASCDRRGARAPR
jgi:hypothetical protein